MTTDTGGETTPSSTSRRASAGSPGRPRSASRHSPRSGTGRGSPRRSPGPPRAASGAADSSGITWFRLLHGLEDQTRARSIRLHRACRCPAAIRLALLYIGPWAMSMRRPEPGGMPADGRRSNTMLGRRRERGGLLGRGGGAGRRPAVPDAREARRHRGRPLD